MPASFKTLIYARVSGDFQLKTLSRIICGGLPDIILLYMFTSRAIKNNLTLSFK